VISRSFRYLVTIAFCVVLTSCGEDDPRPKSAYNYGNTPDLLLKDFQIAWRAQDETRYAELLSDDFRFYFDPDTRSDKGLPEFWNRFTDSTQTSRVFHSTEVNDIRLTMQYSPVPVSVAEHSNWSLINVGDEFLELELKATPGQTEGITLTVDGQIQKFFFRKGRTEADTLASSPTSDQYYIVEWRDLGVQLAISDRLLAIQATTWSNVKSIYSKN
jgi:hypothetical protein